MPEKEKSADVAATPAIGIGRGGAYWTESGDPNAIVVPAVVVSSALETRADKSEKEAKQALGSTLTVVLARLTAKATIVGQE